MENMINRIIELDEQARDDMSKAERLRIDSQQKINDMKEKKRTEYIERARNNIKLIEKEEKTKAAAKLKVIEDSYAKKLKNIESIYSSNQKKWIDEIVNRVIET